MFEWGLRGVSCIFPLYIKINQAQKQELDSSNSLFLINTLAYVHL